MVIPARIQLPPGLMLRSLVPETNSIMSDGLLHLFYDQTRHITETGRDILNAGLRDEPPDHSRPNQTAWFVHRARTTAAAATAGEARSLPLESVEA